jgi:hypothetical protein
MNPCPTCGGSGDVSVPVSKHRTVRVACGCVGREVAAQRRQRADELREVDAMVGGDDAQFDGVDKALTP